MTDVQLRVMGGDAIAAEVTLWRLLSNDPALSGRVERVTRPAEPTELGGRLEFIDVLLSSGVSIALLQSIKAWIQSQRSDVKVSVEVKGRKLEVDATNVRDVEPILRDLLGVPPAAEAPIARRAD